MPMRDYLHTWAASGFAGVIPYADIWDNKPPGIFATIAMVFAVFPDNFGALAVLEGIGIAICNLSIFVLMRKFGAPWDAAAVATAASAVACNLLYYNQHGVLTEIYLIGPAATSMVCFAKAFLERRLPWMLLAGICTGIASLYKTPGLSLFLAQMCFLFLLVLLKKHGWLLLLRCFVVNAFASASPGRRSFFIFGGMTFCLSYSMQPCSITLRIV